MDKRVENGRPKTVLPKLSLDAFDKRFPDEESCKQYLVDVRWNGGKNVKCPRCNNEKVYKISRRPFTWQCKQCNKKGYSFSVLSGTIFMDTKMPLRAWFKVGYLILSSKKGISALQVYRMMARTHGADYRTYWFMCHRLRAAMKNEEWPLSGTVEIDEAYIGGKNANKPLSQRFKMRGRGYVGKTTVIGAIARKGNVVCRVVEDTTTATTNRFISEIVSKKVQLIATDTGAGYYRVHELMMPHETVDHKALEYVRGQVHTNNIESFWSLLKRGIIGTFHQVSAEYLPLYLNEFTFRHNFRHEPDQFRQLISSVHQGF
jgi:transposase-like protein